jgi:hypothetical protein
VFLSWVLLFSSLLSKDSDVLDPLLIVGNDVGATGISNERVHLTFHLLYIAHMSYSYPDAPYFSVIVKFWYIFRYRHTYHPHDKILRQSWSPKIDRRKDVQKIFSLRACLEEALSILPILQVEKQLDLLSPNKQIANHPDAHDAERQPSGRTQ